MASLGGGFAGTIPGEIFGIGSVLSTDADANTTTDGELRIYLAPTWSQSVNEVVKDHIGDVFVEDALVPEGPEVELERFGLDDLAVGDVSDGNISEVRLACHRAQAGELGRGEFDNVVAFGISVREGLELAGWLGYALAQLAQAGMLVLFFWIIIGYHVENWGRVVRLRKMPISNFFTFLG